MPRTRWGNWFYFQKRFALTYQPEARSYSVDLDKCRNSAEVLDWMLQVTHKTWMTPKGACDFVQAITDVLYPQGNICSGGTDKTIEPREVARSRGYTVED